MRTLIQQLLIPLDTYLNIKKIIKVFTICLLLFAAPLMALAQRTGPGNFIGEIGVGDPAEDPEDTSVSYIKIEPPFVLSANIVPGLSDQVEVSLKANKTLNDVKFYYYTSPGGSVNIINSNSHTGPLTKEQQVSEKLLTTFPTQAKSRNLYVEGRASIYTPNGANVVTAMRILTFGEPLWSPNLEKLPTQDGGEKQVVGVPNSLGQ